MTKTLDNKGIAVALEASAKILHANDSSEVLINHALRDGKARQMEGGALAVTTGKFTGRSAGDKFIVEDAETRNKVWWSKTNAMTPQAFDTLLVDMMTAFNGTEIYSQQLFAGTDPANRYNVEVFSPSAWHALFIRNLLIRPNAGELIGFAPDVTVVHLPEFEADPARHGTKTTTCIALDLSRNIVLICGTAYAGEIKKSVFSLFNFHAPDKDILPMHCSANVGEKGDTALFFGLSGTGKTTLSTAPDRALIGDDEHGWSEDGIFNLEGGCYAKAINLTAESEPEIYTASKHEGAILENVVIDDASGKPDFHDDSLTENTRIAYPLTAIPNRSEKPLLPAPSNVVLLTADAFGVLPPVARLSPEQAVYYFLSGYTAKVAGTERGVTEPQATFSVCFGGPFMARKPSVYGKLLAERISQSGAACWLLNTGWTGGPYGVGKRIDLKSTRRILQSILDGELNDAVYRLDETFGLDVPTRIDGVDTTMLYPERTWDDNAAFKAQADRLLGLFAENFSALGDEVAEFANGQPRNSAAA